jgi:hypothetical protein
MRRHLLLAPLLATALGPAASSATAAHCQPRAGEHQLARSAQAVVLSRTVAVSGSRPLQTITGCARRSGHRRLIDVLQRRDDVDPTALVGLRLAGTRVAYVRGVSDTSSGQRTTIIADDAVHGGRWHDLGGSWPFGGFASDGHLPAVTAWAVNADGDVAWITSDPTEPVYETPPPSLVLWHPGLGRRQIDAKADLDGLGLAGHVLSWERDGAPRRLDIAAIPRSACVGTWATGTLDVDLNGPYACQRSTGRVTRLHLPYDGDPIVPVDVNGPYVLVMWTHTGHSGSKLIDVDHATITDYEFAAANAVVDANGSLAWVDDGALWVHDADGTRTVPGQGAGGLTRDGPTVTWPGGPTVTLSP